jgi:hypothetical protein
VYEDRKGNIWIGLSGGEIVSIEKTLSGEMTWRLYTKADGMDQGSYPHILQTRDDMIWFHQRAGREGSINLTAKSGLILPFVIMVGTTMSIHLL